tara:strand:+ start:5705 stop:6475 length:771 start_codon:yes stop_codon:yes gene_type:complete
MKRLSTSFLSLTAVIAFLFSTLHSSAQDSRSLRLGLSFSPQINWMPPDNTNWDSDGARVGMNYGILADFVLVGNDNYMFSTGFTLSHTGGKLSYPTAYEFFDTASIYTGADAEATYKLRYIDIPLAIKLRTNEIGYLHYYGLFGVTTGFNISAKRDIKYQFNGGEYSRDDEDISDDVNLFRASLLIGGGIEYKISGNTYLIVGLSYQNGFTNILKGDTYETDSNGNVIINSNGKPTDDEKVKTRLNAVALNIAVIF